MIDAYEIGIQLVLQDGVSAGLQVITRELAEVDLAVEATSAKLASIGHINHSEIGASMGAAKATSDKGQGAGEHFRPEPEPDPDGQPRPNSGRPDAQLTRDAPTARPAETTQEMQLQAVPGAARVQQGLGPQRASAPAREPDDKLPSALAPQREAAARPNVAAQDRIEAAAPVGVPSGGAALLLDSDRETAPGASTQSLQTVVATVPAPEMPGSVAPVQTEHAITASIADTISRKADEVEDRAPRAKERTGNLATRPVGKATAPWSGVETRNIPLPAASTTEPATAPASRPTDQSQGVSGNIVLDGHLVGYWLSEQMAKEASRPPSGTSFFDPRQSPAWTASGAL